MTGNNLQVAYSVTNHLGVLGNYSRLYSRKSYSSVNYDIVNRNFKEVGVGYFRNREGKFLWEAFFLAGTGKTELKGSTVSSSYFRQAGYNRFAAQTDFKLVEGKFEIAFSPRIFLIRFNNLKDTISVNNPGPSNFLWSDLAVTAQYKVLKFLKISAQTTLTYPISGSSTEKKYFEASPFNASLGLLFNLDLFKK